MSRAARIAMLALITALPPGPALAMLAPAAAQPLPEFTQDDASQWLNSAPLRTSDLVGSVVLLDFWTFECWNCYRSIPWLKQVEQRLGSRGLRVVGIHTPEFDRERVRASVAAKLKQFGVAHPVMLDNDYRYWNALGNQYWPAFYLVDRKGRLRALYVGETHAGDAQALRIEDAIASLLAE